MIVIDGSLTDIDPLEIERLRTIVLSYDGGKALLELSDGELLKAPGFTREQNGVVYPTVAGLLMTGRVLSLKRFVPDNGTCSRCGYRGWAYDCKPWRID